MCVCVCVCVCVSVSVCAASALSFMFSGGGLVDSAQSASRLLVFSQEGMQSSATGVLRCCPAAVTVMVPSIG